MWGTPKVGLAEQCHSAPVHYHISVQTMHALSQQKLGNWKTGNGKGNGKLEFTQDAAGQRRLRTRGYRLHESQRCYCLRTHSSLILFTSRTRKNWESTTVNLIIVMKCPTNFVVISQNCTLDAAQDQLNPLLPWMCATTESDKHLAASL